MTEPGGGKERRRGGKKRMKSPYDIHLITIFRRKDGMTGLVGREREGLIALLKGGPHPISEPGPFVSNWDVETENLAEVEEDISQ
jgi:hypothetical protein